MRWQGRQHVPCRAPFLAHGIFHRHMEQREQDLARFHLFRGRVECFESLQQDRDETLSIRGTRGVPTRGGLPPRHDVFHPRSAESTAGSVQEPRVWSEKLGGSSEEHSLKIGSGFGVGRPWGGQEAYSVHEHDMYVRAMSMSMCTNNVGAGA